MSRRAGRFLPSSSVTVALLEENLPVAYGVVKDLSEAGACIMTNAVLRPGRNYQFRMSFFGGAVLEADAKIVWNETPATRSSGRSEVSAWTRVHGRPRTALQQFEANSRLGGLRVPE